MSKKLSESMKGQSGVLTMPDRRAEPGDRKQMLKQSLVKIRKLQGLLDASERAKRAPIAIVGMACRYPGGANDPETFWELLRDGVDAISDVPPDRWRAADYYDPDPAAVGKAYVMKGGFLDDVECFDAPFFEISPTEARQMDPQQRLLLQVTWEALEHAGVAPDRLAGTATGAFVGMTASDFLLLNMSEGSPDVDTYLASGTSHAVAAGRLAYFLGLQGPAITIDTACSSALVAVHQACLSLRAGECRAALAGGALLMLSPYGHVSACKGGMLSPTGSCKTFDESADGYVRAEGVAMLVLKRLADAEADGDNVLAVIRGTASNQDGRSGGLTAPSGKSQEAVMKRALADAGLSPADVAYVETHGTGTSLGDPIEVQALGAVHANQRDPDKPLLIGSVKTNIGHTEALAGVAGLMKVVLALQHRKIPPHLHCNNPNPYISWADYPIEVARELSDWPAWAERRIAGLSSFGFSGTNVHMIVEEGPSVAVPDRAFERSHHLLTLSGGSEDALSDLAAAYHERLSEDSSVSVEDFCFTASAGRSHFEFRRAAVVATRDDLKTALKSTVEGADESAVLSGKVQANRQPMVAFLLAGQRSQYLQMGRVLYDTQATFRQALDECDALLANHLDQSLRPILYPTPDQQAAASTQLAEARYAQPALFAVEWALARLWRSWGVRPSMVMGDGVGEIAAVCIAGVISLEDGVRLSAEYGRLTQELPGGCGLDAAENSFANALAEMNFSSPRVELFSSATGGLLDAQDLSDAAYWRSRMNCLGPSDDAVKKLLMQGGEAIVEIGPGDAPLEQGRHLSSAGGIPWLPSVSEDRDDWVQILNSLASLYVLGVRVDWDGVHRHSSRKRVSLPTYPFARTRYPIQSQDAGSGDEHQASQPAPEMDASGEIDDWFYELAWRPAARVGNTASQESDEQEAKLWIVFADSQGVGESLRVLLCARGADVVCVQPGEHFKRTGERDFVLRPDREEDYERVLKDVLGQDDPPSCGIAHLWSLDATPTEALTAELLESSQSLVSTSVLLLVQRLAILGGRRHLRLWLATLGAQPVEMADAPLSLAQTPLWGIGRTIAAEHAEFWGGMIDIDHTCSVKDAAETLCDEITAFDEEDQTVHRDGVRYVPKMLRNSELAQATGRLGCRPDRAYLITGGLGGLGLEAARWLIRRGARRLILLGRTKFPERREWKNAKEDTVVGQRVAAIRELESLGASVHLARGDVANQSELYSLLDTYQQEGWPPIGGVLHAAGTVEYGALLEHDVNKLHAVMRAKVLGGWLLHRYFDTADLDFFISYSSAASIMNSPMLGGYAAANAFLDALAHFRRSRGLTSVCVNWGSWSEIGMATQHDAGDRAVSDTIAPSISPIQGYEALERILLHSATQVVVLPIDWNQWSNLYSGLTRSGIFDELTKTGSEDVASKDHGAWLQDAVGEGRRTKLFDYLSESVGGLLGLSKQDLDHDKRISQLGFDSLMAVELKNRLEKDLNLVVPMGALLAGPTIGQLTSTLLDGVSISVQVGPEIRADESEFDSEEGEL